MTTTVILPGKSKESQLQDVRSVVETTQKPHAEVVAIAPPYLVHQAKAQLAQVGLDIEVISSSAFQKLAVFDKVLVVFQDAIPFNSETAVAKRLIEANKYAAASVIWVVENETVFFDKYSSIMATLLTPFLD